MITYIIIVNDAGELKTVTQQEIEDHGGAHAIEREGSLDTVLNDIIDKRET